MSSRCPSLIALLFAATSSLAPVHVRASDADGAWSPVSTPAAHSWETATYDPVRHHILRFGGIGENPSSALWVLDPGAPDYWTPMPAQGTPPPPRYGHTAVYDSQGDRLLVYGGSDGTGYLGDVWALSLTGTPTWSLLSPGGTTPAARAFHAAIYDPVRNRMVVFGGTNGGNLGDAEALTLSPSPAWSVLAPPGALPRARQLHSAIFDAGNDRMIVYGGRVSADTVLGDVWSLALAAPVWSELVPGGTPPDKRANHKAYHDAAANRMVVSLGMKVVYCPTPTCDPPYQDFEVSDTWALSLTGPPAWSQIPTSGGAPINNASRLAAFDPVNNRLVVFGGGSLGLLDVGTASWSAETPGGSPHDPKFWAAGGWDAMHEQLIVVGGGIPGSSDTHAIPIAPGGAPWSLLDSGAPTERGRATIILDTNRNRFVLFGGVSGQNPNWIMYNDVWVWPIASGGPWAQLATFGTPPAARAAASGVYDPARDMIVFFGGYTQTNPFVSRNDVWVLPLNFPLWAQVTPTGTPPAARAGHSAICDPGRDRMVVFGGSPDDNTFNPPNELNDVWALNLAGPSWTQLPSPSPPRQRYQHSAVFDTYRDRMVIFGGELLFGSGVRYANDTWAYGFGGGSWTQLAPAGPLPQGRASQIAVRDAAHDRLIMFGGFGSSHEVWALQWQGIVSVPPGPGPLAALSLAVRANPVRGRRAGVAFTLPSGTQARIELLDTAGRRLVTRTLGHLDTGPHEIDVDLGAEARPGIYFLRLVTDRGSAARRVAVLE